MSVQLGEGTLVVSAYQATVAGDVRQENGHKPSFDLFATHCLRSIGGRIPFTPIGLRRPQDEAGPLHCQPTYRGAARGNTNGYSGWSTASVEFFPSSIWPRGLQAVGPSHLQAACTCLAYEKRGRAFTVSGTSVMPEREGRVLSEWQPDIPRAKVNMQGHTSVPYYFPRNQGIGLRCDLSLTHRDSRSDRAPLCGSAPSFSVVLTVDPIRGRARGRACRGTAGGTGRSWQRRGVDLLRVR
jgi:hypothetical protein